MLKRIGLFALLLFAFIGVSPSTAAFAQEYRHGDRDYYNGDHRRDSRWREFRGDERRERRWRAGNEWREHEWREHERAERRYYNHYRYSPYANYYYNSYGSYCPY